MKNNRLERLCDAIETSVKESCKEPVTVAFSGGVDSSLVAFLARKYTDVELIAVGIPNSYDLDAAKSAAKMIDMKLRTIIVEPNEMVLEGLNMQKRLELSSIEIEFMLPFWIAAKNSTNPILMCGQGADELFGGYARFRKKDSQKDLAKEVNDLINRLPDREKKIADFFNRNLSCPYLSKNVVKTAEKFTIEERIGKIGKVPLREAASKLELPKEIANRKKKAAQYGSGSQKAIKNIIKHRVKFNIKFENKKIAESIATPEGTCLRSIKFGTNDKRAAVLKAHTMPINRVRNTKAQMSKKPVKAKPARAKACNIPRNSVTNIIECRLTRSATTPAIGVKITVGKRSAKATTPNQKPELVNSQVNQPMVSRWPQMPIRPNPPPQKYQAKLR